MNKVEEVLATTAKQSLEKLKKEGAAVDDLELLAATYDILPKEKSSDPISLWDCYISFNKHLQMTAALRFISS